jgi:hypothetical protein
MFEEMPPERFSKILLFEQFAKLARVLTRDHEHPVTAVVDRLRIFRADGHMRLHDLQDEEAVFGDELFIDHLAFEIREALLDQGRLDLFALSGRDVEARKFFDVAP